MSVPDDVAPYTVLFLCNTNCGRSIMAEAILNRDGNGRFRAYSAGTRPASEVNPYALETLVAEGYPIIGLRSKSVEEFLGPDAPEMDFIFTLCDEAAGEETPEWPGDPATAHWGIENPSTIDGSPIDKERAFETAFHFLKNRLLAFSALPLKSLDRLSLHSHLQAIGQQDGASASAEKVD
ncbi:arsenate reductase ArsC [Aquabacter spiritensis]|uniref:Arsenate reductase n=1 Tax=Aquabacter spiritensis TaxID=933073 RepID=A0A4R3LU87_9HYPH|nr:arsenate reductase ArsC [Aquabacter spiritensis]TCT03169.1 arsenate reductase [Aquabacter spiritensis]